MKRQTAEWVRKAEEDWDAARDLAARRPPLRDPACFHCQQAAEKYLKGLMEELGLSVPKAHDLEDLRTLLLPHHPPLRPLRRGLKFLTRFSEDIRDPREWASKREAETAFRWADRVRTAARALLGIRPRGPRRKK